MTRFLKFCVGPIFLTLACANSNSSRLTEAKVKTSDFHYDEAAGKCVSNRSTESGFNSPDIESLFSSLNDAKNAYGPATAECVDFGGFDFNQYAVSTAVVLDGWNFKGAKLSNAKMHFMRIENADLRGADLRDFKFGYVEIRGAGDQYTQGGICVLKTDFSVNCRR